MEPYCQDVSTHLAHCTRRKPAVYCGCKILSTLSVIYLYLFKEINNQITLPTTIGRRKVGRRGKPVDTSLIVGASAHWAMNLHTHMYI